MSYPTLLTLDGIYWNLLQNRRNNHFLLNLKILLNIHMNELTCI
jgi:hypothetical protein